MCTALSMVSKTKVFKSSTLLRPLRRLPRTERLSTKNLTVVPMRDWLNNVNATVTAKSSNCMMYVLRRVNNRLKLVGTVYANWRGSSSQ